MVSVENHTPSQMDAPNSGLVAFTWSGDELCGSSTTTRLLGGKAPLRRCLYCIFMRWHFTGLVGSGECIIK